MAPQAQRDSRVDAMAAAAAPLRWRWRAKPSSDKGPAVEGARCHGYGAAYATDKGPTAVIRSGICVLLVWRMRSGARGLCGSLSRFTVESPIAVHHISVMFDYYLWRIE